MKKYTTDFEFSLIDLRISFNFFFVNAMGQRFQIDAVCFRSGERALTTQ